MKKAVPYRRFYKICIQAEKPPTTSPENSSCAGSFGRNTRIWAFSFFSRFFMKALYQQAAFYESPRDGVAGICEYCGRGPGLD
ncbi:MAG: hypothetical protein LBJ21_00125, partial [Acidobacteriota bacterium]|nr:hypothetical protein [Acidobacteriota bacterium]